MIELPQQLESDTNAWHEISTLQQLPDVDVTTGTHKQLDLAKEIWLMCLAPQVRSALHDTDNRSIQELLTEAEHRDTAHYAATRLRPAPSDVTEFAAIQHQRAPRQADKPYMCSILTKGSTCRNIPKPSEWCRQDSLQSTTPSVTLDTC